MWRLPQSCKENRVWKFLGNILWCIDRETFPIVPVITYHRSSSSLEPGNFSFFPVMFQLLSCPYHPICCVREFPVCWIATAKRIQLVSGVLVFLIPAFWLLDRGGSSPPTLLFIWKWVIVHDWLSDLWWLVNHKIDDTFYARRFQSHFSFFIVSLCSTLPHCWIATTKLSSLFPSFASSFSFRRCWIATAKLSSFIFRSLITNLMVGTYLGPSIAILFLLYFVVMNRRHLFRHADLNCVIESCPPFFCSVNSNRFPSISSWPIQIIRPMTYNVCLI